MASGKSAVDKVVDQYSEVVLIASVVVAFLTFPLGLAVPLYLYIKADQGEGSQQSALEVWTVILGGVFGIAAVELAGRIGAKIYWILVVSMAVLGALSFLTFLIGLP